MIAGKLTLFVDDLPIRRLRYENKAQRDDILNEWAGYRLGDVSYTILPDEHETKEPTISDVAKRFMWDFQPYKKPKFEEEEWVRPPSNYSNNGHQKLIDKDS